MHDAPWAEQALGSHSLVAHHASAFLNIQNGVFVIFFIIAECLNNGQTMPEAACQFGEGFISD